MSSVFVSYAHVDNRPFSGKENGWITLLVNNLRGEVNRKMGREENYSLWMDFRLKGNDELTTELEKQVKAAQTLLLFLSHGWLASEWCRRELALFLEDADKQHSGRIFVIEQDRVEKPKSISDSLGYRFWQETDQDKVRMLGYPVPQPDWPEHSCYFDKLFDLADDLAAKINETQTPHSQNFSPIKTTVYVAPVDNALYEQRNLLITELRQFGIDSIPRNNEFELDSFKQDMARDLAQCSHFIQLLDTEWNLGVPAKQLQMAASCGTSILGWRSQDLDFSKARKEQQKLLESKHVIACTLSEFTQYIRKAVLPKSESESQVANPPSAGKMVFVHTGQQDMELAKKITKRLKEKGFGTALPRYEEEPGKIRMTIESYLQLCTSLLLVQFETPDEVIESYLVDALLHESQNGKSLPAVICRKPDAEELQFHPAELRIYPCGGDFDAHCIEQFLPEA